MNTYLTIKITNPFAPSPRVYADTWEDAEAICPNGYKVDGLLIEEFECDDSIADFYQNKLN